MFSISEDSNKDNSILYTLIITYSYIHISMCNMYNIRVQLCSFHTPLNIFWGARSYAWHCKEVIGLKQEKRCIRKAPPTVAKLQAIRFGCLGHTIVGNADQLPVVGLGLERYG